jgi:hypothetical protein
MHTHTGNTAQFHFNSDFSGEVIIAGVNEVGEPTTMVVAAEDILDFVARKYVALKRISEIEQMDSKDLLK